MVLKTKNNARAEYARLVAKGFSPSHTFDMSDEIIAFDNEHQQLALVNYERHVTPRGFDPPVDRDSFSVRSTDVFSFADIESISVKFSGNVAFVTVGFFQPNTINSKLVLDFQVWRANVTVKQMLAAWPAKTIIVES